MFKNNFTKKSCLISFGGGKITDLGGYCASVFLRGIDSIYFPTTLLCMVDASIGGKCAINNLNYGKNLIGTFSQPKYVIINLDIITKYEDINVIIKDGMSEMIKKFLLFDSDNSQLIRKVDSIKVLDKTIELENNIKKKIKVIDPLDIPLLKSLIIESVKLKVSIIEKDTLDKDYRNTLNFGHTIGHGIEAIDAFKFSHGEAVSIGLVEEIKILANLGYCSFDLMYQVKELLNKYGLPTEIPDSIDISDLVKCIISDKKNSEINKFKIVNFRGIGKIDNPCIISIDYKELKWISNRSIRVNRNNPIIVDYNDRPLEIDFLQGSKSICNRALILAALSKKHYRLNNFLVSDDTLVMMKSLIAFSYDCEIITTLSNNNTKKLILDIKPKSNRNNDFSNNNNNDIITINVDNSGTTARFIVAFIIFHLKNKKVVINCANRMTERPNKDIFLFLGNFKGFKIEYLKQEYCFPIAIETGSSVECVNRDIMIKGSISSQYVSSVLMSCFDFFVENNLKLKYKKEVTYQFIEMTIKTLASFNREVIYNTDNEEFEFNYDNKDNKCVNNHNNISVIDDNSENIITDYIIEPDASTANFYLGHIALNGGNIVIPNLDKTSIQGDSNMVTYLQKLNFSCLFDNNKIVFNNSSRKDSNCLIKNTSITLDSEQITDSFIIFSLICCSLKNVKITLTGIANQSLKESDRIKIMSENINKIGVYSYIDKDRNLIIDTNYSTLYNHCFHDIEIETANDHRIAMAFTIMAYHLRNNKSLIINDKDCVNKTHPEFYYNFNKYFNYEYLPKSNINHFKSEFNLSKSNILNSCLVLIGMKNSGKSTMGKIVANQMEFDFYDLDEILFYEIWIDILLRYLVEVEFCSPTKEKDIELIEKEKEKETQESEDKEIILNENKDNKNDEFDYIHEHNEKINLIIRWFYNEDYSILNGNSDLQFIRDMKLESIITLYEEFLLKNIKNNNSKNLKPFSLSFSSNNLTSIIEIFGIDYFRNKEAELFKKILFKKPIFNLNSNILSLIKKEKDLEECTNSTLLITIRQLSKFIEKIKSLINDKKILKTTTAIISCGGGIVMNTKLHSVLNSLPNTIFIHSDITNIEKIFRITKMDYYLKDSLSQVYQNRLPIYKKLAKYELYIPGIPEKELHIETIDSDDKLNCVSKLGRIFNSSINNLIGFNKQKISYQGSIMNCMNVSYEQFIQRFDVEKIPLFNKNPFTTETINNDNNHTCLNELMELRFDEAVEKFLVNSNEINSITIDPDSTKVNSVVLDLIIENIITSVFYYKYKNTKTKFLFTLRTKEEGGMYEFNNNYKKSLYYNILLKVLKSGYFEFIDLEYKQRLGKVKEFDDMINLIFNNKNNTRIIYSKHYIKDEGNSKNTNNRSNTNNKLCFCLTTRCSLCSYRDTFNLNNCKKDFFVMNNSPQVDIVKIITTFSNENEFSQFKSYVNKYSCKPVIMFQLGEENQNTRYFNSIYTPVYDDSITKPTGKGQLSYNQLYFGRNLLNISSFKWLKQIVQKSDSKESFYSVIGKEVTNSASPKLHNYLWNYFFDYCKINNINEKCIYTNITTNKDFFDELTKTSNKNSSTNNTLYYSVTMPYKELILESKSNVNVNYSEDTSSIKSCNTYKKINNMIFGYNTDYVAMYYLIINKINITNSNNVNILLIGAGGAAKGILKALEDLNLNKDNIYVYNRSKCTEFINKNNIKLFNHDKDSENIDTKSKIKNSNGVLFDIVISSVPKNTDIVFFENVFNNISPETFYFDLAYNINSDYIESNTNFLSWLQNYHLINSLGNNYIGGIEFLVVQGIMQFEIFSGLNVFPYYLKHSNLNIIN